jgi:hypothetical protein
VKAATRCRTGRQFGLVCALNHPSGAVFLHIFPVFCLFLQNEPNPHFFLTYSFHNTSTFFSWVRLVKTLFYIKPSRWERRDATPQAPHQGEPSGRERMQSPPASNHSAGLCPHVSMIHAHTPFLPQCLQTSKCTLEGLEGLEAFLL